MLSTKMPRPKPKTMPITQKRKSVVKNCSGSIHRTLNSHSGKLLILTVRRVYKQLIKKYAKIANLEASPHTLRVHALLDRIPITAVQKQVGHKKLLSNYFLFRRKSNLCSPPNNFLKLEC